MKRTVAILLAFICMIFIFPCTVLADSAPFRDELFHQPELQ